MNDEHQAILDKIRSRGALKQCTECGGTDFEYIGHSTGAAMYLSPDSLTPGELLPNTRSYKSHIFSCKTCYRLLGFIDRE